MLSPEATAVAGTLVGTLLGSGIQYFNSRKSAEEASERIFRQQALDSKFERMETLHDSLDDCLSKFSQMLIETPTNLEDYSERVRKPYDEFINAADKARIFLAPEEREVVEQAREEFNQARVHLITWAEHNDPDFVGREAPIGGEYEKSREDLEAAAKPVFELVRKKLDPDYEATS